MLIDLIKKPIIVKQASGKVIACNQAYLEFRKISAIDLID